LTTPAPRINGKVDLSGVRQAEPIPATEFTRMLGAELVKVQVDLSDITKHVINVSWEIKPEDQPLPLEGASILYERERAPADHPLSHCLPIGIPAVIFTYDFKMIQAPQEIVMLSETGDLCRQIYTDGRSLPKQAEPSSGTQWASGKATPLSSKRPGLRKGAGSTF
jgi:hypothetical protein